MNRNICPFQQGKEMFALIGLFDYIRDIKIPLKDIRYGYP